LLTGLVLSFEFRDRIAGLTLAQNVFGNIVVILNLLRDDSFLEDLALGEAVLNRVLFSRTLSKGMLVLVELPIVVSVLLFTWFVIMMRFLVKLPGLLFLLFRDDSLFDLLILFGFSSECKLI
jgi:hypothetical protein